MITGHNHLFNIFNRKGVVFAVISPAGGKDDLTLNDFGKGRKFKGFKTGPLPVSETTNSYGYEYHIESFIWKGMKIKTYLALWCKLVYTVVDLNDGSVIRQYEQIIPKFPDKNYE